MRLLASALSALAVLYTLASSPVLAGSRVALVLAVEDYSQLAKSPISVEISKDIGAAFAAHGFDVTVSENPTNAVSRAALRDFLQKASHADAAVIIMTGHGATAGGLTYFLPANAEITRDTDLFSRGLALPGIAQIVGRAKVGAVLFAMTAANIPSTLQSISSRPTFSGDVEPNVVLAFSTSDKVPSSRIDMVSQQAVVDLREATMAAKLKLSALVAAVAVGGSGKVFGDVPDPDWTQSSAVTAAVAGGIAPDTNSKPETSKQGQRPDAQRAPLAENPASMAHISGAVRGGADREKPDSVATLQFVEALMGPEQRQAVQTRLRQLELYKGPIDAAFGDLTRQAIRDYQRGLSAETTGYFTPSQLRMLMEHTVEADARNTAQTERDYQQGERYLYGRGVPQDYEKARKWYEKAAAAGNGGGLNALGWLYQNGWGVSRDYAKASQFYEKAAAAGNGLGMANLGWLYYQGLGVTRDYGNAREWSEKSVALGNDEGINILGVLYENGHGVPKDTLRARELYEKAAAAGNGHSMNHLGFLYEQGRGVPNDYTKAREWYEKAAAAGSDDAMNNLGRFYQTGWGGPQDYTKARAWYERAAAAGNRFGKVNLASLPPIKEAPFDFARAAKLVLAAAMANDDQILQDLRGDMKEWGENIRTEIQRELARLRHYNGPTDGKWDDDTRAAVSQYLIQRR
jgi:TPR repeat protein